MGIAGYILQARQQSRTEVAQAALAHEAEVAQAAFDIAHQRREAKLSEVEEHLKISRSLLLSYHSNAHAVLVFTFNECYAEDDPSSVLQAVGTRMMPAMMAGPWADFFTAESIAVWTNEGLNSFSFPNLGVAVNQNYFPVPGIHAMFGFVGSMPKDYMYLNPIGSELVQRYEADPSSPFAVRMREFLAFEYVPLLRETTVRWPLLATDHFLICSKSCGL